MSGRKQLPRLRPPKEPCPTEQHDWYPFDFYPRAAASYDQPHDRSEVYVVCRRCWRWAYVKVELLGTQTNRPKRRRIPPDDAPPAAR